MKSIMITVAAFAFLSPLSHAGESHLTGKLKPLQHLVGSWSQEGEHEGKAYQMSCTAVPESGGTVLRHNYEFKLAGDTPVLWMTLTFSRADSEKLTYVAAGSEGTTLIATASIEDGALVVEGNSIKADGTTEKVTSSLRSDASTFTATWNEHTFVWDHNKRK